jgi:hypothetical protein
MEDPAAKRRTLNQYHREWYSSVAWANNRESSDAIKPKRRNLQKVRDILPAVVSNVSVDSHATRRRDWEHGAILTQPRTQRPRKPELGIMKPKQG